MNFNDLQKIETADWYLDRAFKVAKQTGEHYFPRTSGTPFERTKKTEHEKIRAFNKEANERLSKIIKNFPNLDALPEFYQELLHATLDFELLKKSLGSIQWALASLTKFSQLYERKVKSARTVELIKTLMREYYGRASSVLKQIKSNIAYLEECRKTMRDFPAIKTDLFTVAITGFPNIGKSTLLSKITPAKPEIKDYAFTTKGVNLGYTQYGIRKVQFVDTPGVLNRQKKMNNIETQAYLVLKYVANVIVYVIDLTEPYALKEQEKLLKGLKDYDKPLIIYLSKSDIIDAETIEKAKKKYKAVVGLPELQKKLEKSMKEIF